MMRLGNVFPRVVLGLLLCASLGAAVEPAAAGGLEAADKDWLRAAFIPKRQAAFVDRRLSLEDFASYAVQTLQLRLPPELSGLFTDLDVLYLNGFLGGAADGALRLSPGPFTLGRLAELLARIDGYADALEASSDQTAKAVDILQSTGYYTAAEFLPLDAEVTLAKAQSLLLRTSRVSRRLEKDFVGQSLVWLDRSELNQGRVTLRLSDAARFERYSWTYGRQVFASGIAGAGYMALAIAPDRADSGGITINVYEVSGAVWQFTADFALTLTEPLFLVRLDPKVWEPGVLAHVSFAVPEGLDIAAVNLQADFLSQPLALQKHGAELWRIEFQLPETLTANEYTLNFGVERSDNVLYVKKYTARIRQRDKSGKTAARQSSPPPKLSVNKKSVSAPAAVTKKPEPPPRRVFTKVSAKRVKPGELLSIYGGIAGDEAVKGVQVFLAEQRKIIPAVRQSAHVWRAELSDFRPGRNEYKVVAFFADGATAERAGYFWCETTSNITAAPAPRRVPVSANVQTKAPPVQLPSKDKTETPRLNKVYYPVEIMLSPPRPAPGAKLRVTARYASVKVREVYADIGGRSVPLQKNGEVWQAEYTLPSQQREIYLKIYARDTQDNLSMTEKVIVF